jgi:hypothetical protein
MLSVDYAGRCVFILVLLNVVMLSVIMPGVIMLNVVMLSVVMLNVVMLSVVASLHESSKLGSGKVSLLVDEMAT